jgi:hypothetical protein
MGRPHQHHRPPSCPVSRPAARPRNTHAVTGHPSQGCQRTAGAFESGDDSRSLQPRPARNARGCGREARRGAEGGAKTGLKNSGQLGCRGLLQARLAGNGSKAVAITGGRKLAPGGNHNDFTGMRWQEWRVSHYRDYSVSLPKVRGKIGPLSRKSDFPPSPHRIAVNGSRPSSKKGAGHRFGHRNAMRLARRSVSTRGFKHARA